MIEALDTKAAGKPIEILSCGKPQKGSFDYAMKILKQRRKDLGYDTKPLRTVYFVGDTPESNIHGTNEYGKDPKAEWYSILVKTGAYQTLTQLRAQDNSR